MSPILSSLQTLSLTFGTSVFGIQWKAWQLSFDKHSPAHSTLVLQHLFSKFGRNVKVKKDLISSLVIFYLNCILTTIEIDFWHTYLNFVDLESVTSECSAAYILLNCFILMGPISTFASRLYRLMVSSTSFERCLWYSFIANDDTAKSSNIKDWSRIVCLDLFLTQVLLFTDSFLNSTTT